MGFFVFCMRNTFKGSGYRNTWVEIEGQKSKKYHILRKLGLNFSLLFWVKNSKKTINFEIFTLVSHS